MAKQREQSDLFEGEDIYRRKRTKRRGERGSGGKQLVRPRATVQGKKVTFCVLSVHYIQQRRRGRKCCYWEVLHVWFSNLVGSRLHGLQRWKGKSCKWVNLVCLFIFFCKPAKCQASRPWLMLLSCTVDWWCHHGYPFKRDQTYANYTPNIGDRNEELERGQFKHYHLFHAAGWSD